MNQNFSNGSLTESDRGSDFALEFDENGQEHFPDYPNHSSMLTELSSIDLQKGVIPQTPPSPTFQILQNRIQNQNNPMNPSSKDSLHKLIESDLKMFMSHEGEYSVADLVKAYRGVLLEVRKLSRTVDTLKREVLGLEYESSQWTLKYSRRLLQVSNIVLSIYLGILNTNRFFSAYSRRFFSQLLPRVKDNVSAETIKLRTLILSKFIGEKSKRRLMHRANQKRLYSKNRSQSLYQLFISIFWRAGLRIVLLILSTFWLQKVERWKRRTGLLISFLSNVHAAITTDVSPWAIYFNVFTIITYVTARNYKYMYSSASQNLQPNFVADLLYVEEEAKNEKTTIIASPLRPSSSQSDGSSTTELKNGNPKLWNE